MKKKPKLTLKDREAIAAYNDMMLRWSKVPKFSTSGTHDSRQRTQPAIPPLTTPPGRETPRYPSLDTGQGTATKPNQPMRYTGDKMIGIGTLHKSNAVPVFSTDEATEMARMRRG